MYSEHVLWNDSNIFARFFSFYRENFDDESPFHPDTSNSDDRSSTDENGLDTKNLNCDKFQELTAEAFAQLVKEIKVCCFIINDSNYFRR